jgi:hypothetical protein
MCPVGCLPTFAACNSVASAVVHPSGACATQKFAWPRSHYRRTAGVSVNLGHHSSTRYLELHALAEMTAVTETGS